MLQYKITNHISVFVWIFTLFFNSLGGIVYYLLLTEPVGDNLFNNVMKIFFLIAIPVVFVFFINWSLKSFISTVIFDREKLLITIIKQYIYKKELKTYTYEEVDEIDLEEGKDTEGDVYLRLIIYFTDCEHIVLKEGHSKDRLLKYLTEIKNYL
jgi:hypothetical protein